MVTTTTYCSVNDIIDFLRVPITSTTTPNKEMVRKIIARKEEEFDRRVGHTWKRSSRLAFALHIWMGYSNILTA